MGLHPSLFYIALSALLLITSLNTYHLILRCLVVDDESLARKLLEENISQIPFLELVGMCKNPFEAMQFLQENEVDLMFLDIQMPGMLGTQFLKSLKTKPAVIFVTAYSNYAVESYELEVIDYLLKPVSLERFTQAAYKALSYQSLQVGTINSQSSDKLIADSSKQMAEDFFFVNVEYSLVKIVINDIAYVESMKDYVKIFLKTQPKPVLTKSTLKSIEEKLPSRNFLRVHKSFVVNIDKIDSIRSQTISIGDNHIPVSDANLNDLMRAINHLK